MNVPTYKENDKAYLELTEARHYYQMHKNLMQRYCA
jgi:hypothetical protein